MKNNQKLLLYEDKNKKNGAQQKLRGKELNTVLDTGEKKKERMKERKRKKKKKKRTNLAHTI